MKQQFKIRLENKKDKNICVMYCFLNNKNNGLLQFPINLYEWKILSIDNYIGIKDKKKKKIYENCIVEYIFPNGRICKFIIKYSDINCWFYGESLSKDIYIGGIKGQELRKSEIIGDIYEDKN